ncbi:hypothetical protein LXA43DRAFT_974885 [Ganoderma leucocontextum]|nr:hypothetical protein LXA43DRAFT_976018 [Ganoderma leucocontextum]KAI1788291.1 hypothetical protein LXA43DRAFT_974885 [Ganoderma leucocontextum]
MPTAMEHAPAVCNAWEGKVASLGGLDAFVFTSPNMDYIPEYPVGREILKTYEDGRWGLHEYSRWPQAYVDGMMHLACIPRHPILPYLPPVLFRSLRSAEDWAEREEVMVRGLGFIRSETRSELVRAAGFAIERFHSMRELRDDVRLYGAFLVMLLRQVVDRMNYVPSHCRTAVAIAAHVQRLCLELAGLKTYIEQVVLRLNMTRDWSSSRLPVLGGFVRDLTDAQTWCRAGVPVWLIQPLTADLVVWRVVQPEGLPVDMSRTPCDPPILHKAGSFVGVPNVTGSWLTGMLMSVSKDIAGSHLEGLNLTAVPQVPDESPQSKRARTHGETETRTDLTMRAAVISGGEATSSKPKTRRGRKKTKRQAEKFAATPDSAAVPGPHTPVAGPSVSQHPSRTFYPSAFAQLSPIWASALQAASPVKQGPNAALYFYPPPFLLDTIPSIGAKCPHPHDARIDEKVLRYLHNLARIREFCRTRIFDRTLDRRPLTISEWRVALWGDYRTKTHPPKGPDSSDVRREKRRQDERNVISLLLHQVAHMDSYTPDVTILLEGASVDAASVTSDPEIRAILLWEAHELNFRADLMALDHLLVNTKDWLERSKWEREMLVSGVWGEPSSGVTILPSLDPGFRKYCWHAPPDEGWQECRQYLHAFCDVLSRWPGCPEVVLQAVNASGSNTAEEHLHVLGCAVEFYVRSFVQSFARLPTPPIPFPL